MPLTKCNYSCAYCYLKGYSSTDILSLEKAESLVHEYVLAVGAKPAEVTIDIYGGEITLLPDLTRDKDYLLKLYRICCKYADHINLISNNSRFEEISHVYESLNDEEASKFYCSASLFNKERHNWKTDVRNTAMLSPTPRSILTVVTRDILETPCEKLLEAADLTGAESINFLQYVPSVFNTYQDISNREYSDKIKAMIQTYLQGNYKIKLANLDRLEACLREEYCPVNNDLVFILPSGYFGTVAYTEQGKEFFLSFPNLQEFFRYNRNLFNYHIMKCTKEYQCPYTGHCAADHIKDWSDKDECCGFKKLLKWYQNAVFKDNK